MPAAFGPSRLRLWASVAVLFLSVVLTLAEAGAPGMLSRLVQFLLLSAAVLAGISYWVVLPEVARPWSPVPEGGRVESSRGSENLIDLRGEDRPLVSVQSNGAALQSGHRLQPPRRQQTATSVLSSVPASGYSPPRFGRGSKAQRREWVLPRRLVQPGIACDAASLGDLTLRAASVVGPGHRCEEPAGPRQDAYAVVVDSLGEHFVAAVADGVGSSRHAEVGAQVAVSMAAQLFSGAATDLKPGEADCRDIYRQVAGQMSEQARARGWQDEDVCAALITAVVPAAPDRGSQRHALVAWVGDVSAWVLRQGRWMCVAGDRKEENGLASNAVQNPLPFGAAAVETADIPLLPGDVLVLVTDGVGDGLATLPELRDYLASRWEHPVPVSAFLDDVGYDAERFLDDRTTVSIWLGGNTSAAGGLR